MNTLDTLTLAALGAAGNFFAYLRWRRNRRPAYAAGTPVGPVVHKSLPPALVARISAFEPVFADLYPRTHAEWLDGFMRDHHPEREVAIWEHVALALNAFTLRRNPRPEVRREAFALLAARSQTADLAQITAQMRHLSAQEIQQVIAAYDAPPQPIVTGKRDS